MTRKDRNMDDYIREILLEEFNKIPDPPLSKEEAWKKVWNAFKVENRKKRSLRFIRQIQRIALSLAVLLVLSIIIFQSQNTHAFNWLTNLFTNVQGTVTELMISVSDGDSSSDPNPTPETEVIPTETRIEPMSLSEAKEATRFPITLPKYIPDGYVLDRVLVERVNDEKSDRIRLNYSKGEEVFYIQEALFLGATGYSISVDNEDTKVKETEVNGKKATLFIFKNGSKNLVWVDQKIQFMISGNIPEVEMMKIAESF